MGWGGNRRGAGREPEGLQGGVSTKRRFSLSNHSIPWGSHAYDNNPVLVFVWFKAGKEG